MFILISNFYKNRIQELISYSYSICKNRQMAEDIVQNLFLTLLLKNDFSKIKNIDSYIAKSVRLNTYNQIRNVKRHKRILEDNFVNTNNSHCYKEFDYDFLKEKIIKDCIDSLPEKRKKVFIMKRIECRSLKEISEELSISSKTVENHITNAIKELEKKLYPINNNSIL